MVQSTYSIVMQELEISDANKAKEIQELLSAWRKETSLGIRVVDNLKADCKISESAMQKILEKLYSNRHLSVDELEANIYKKTCFGLALSGPPIDKSKIPEKIGGAKAADEFIVSMAERMKFATTDRATELVSKLCSNTETLTNAENDIYFTEYGSWVTWSEHCQDDPFDFATPPDELLKLLSNLGLTHRNEGMSHLLFVYSKHVITEIYYPTIADANLYSYFKCTDSEDYCGRTQPWNREDVEKRNLPAKEIKPRPEGVHKPIQLKSIDKPVKAIKGTVGVHFLS